MEIDWWSQYAFISSGMGELIFPVTSPAQKYASGLSQPFPLYARSIKLQIKIFQPQTI